MRKQALPRTKSQRKTLVRWAYDDSAMVHKAININGSKIHYWVKNPDINRTIICLHGFRGSHRSLASIAMGLDNYRVVVPDLPGCGRSERLKVTHSYNEYVEFLERFAAQLKLNQFMLLCHSLSAAAGIVYAHKFPTRVSGLILMTPVISVRLGQAYYKVLSRLPRIIKNKVYASLKILTLENQILTVFSDTKTRRQIYLARMEELKEFVETVIIENILSANPKRLVSQAQGLRVPVMVISGQKDALVRLGTVKRLYRRFQNAKLVVIRGAGHMMPYEKPQEIVNAIVNFDKA